MPATDLNFPNLNLTSSTQIDPPYSAPNTFVVDGPAGGSGTAIAWARIQTLAPRPVVLVHGIAPGFSSGAIPNLDFGSLFGNTSPDRLSGWTTWNCWTSACPQQPDNDFLFKIGVPNIRPDEENNQAAAQTPTSSDRDSPEHYVSDARVYMSTSHHYWDNAIDVNDHIAMVLRRYGVDSVNLVTHSMGGLDAAWAIRGDGSAVSHFIMLAPPYIGSDLADFIRQRPLIGNVLNAGFPALDDLTTSYWHWIMPKGIPANPLTADYAIIGTNPNSGGVGIPSNLDEIAFGYDCFLSIGGLCAHIYTNDNAVPEYSARAAPGQFLGTVSADNHYTIAQDPTVFSDVQALLGPFATGIQVQAGQAQVRTAVQAAQRTRATTTARVQTAGSMAAMAAQSDATGGSGVQYGPLLSGSVQPSTTVTTTFALPANPTTAETLVWDTGALTMTLVDPSGGAVTPVSAGVAYTQTAEADGSGALAYTLSNPAPGMWTAVITDTAASGQVANYQLGASYASPVTLSAPGGATIYQPGAGVPVSVTLADATGAAVTATAELSGTTPATVTLQDLGNGIYGGSFGALLTPGQYEVHLVATGTDNGQPFVSTGLSFATLASGAATLKGPTPRERRPIRSGCTPR